MFLLLYTLPYLIGATAISALIFFFIGKSIKSKNEIALLTQLETLSEDLKSKEKENKVLKKEANKYKSEKNNISTKYDKLKSAYDPISREAVNIKNQLSELETEKESHLSTIARLQNDLKNSKEKHELTTQKLNEIQKDDKSWKREIDTYKKSSEDFEKKWNQAEDRKVQLSRKLKQFENTAEEIQQLQYDLKSHKMDLKRVNKDLAYWEKQHYDTHHKLTKTTEQLEQLTATNENQLQLNKGMQIKEQNMLKLIEEYKTKLIHANNKLHDLKNKQGALN